MALQNLSLALIFGFFLSILLWKFTLPAFGFLFSLSILVYQRRFSLMPGWRDAILMLLGCLSIVYIAMCIMSCYVNWGC